MSWLSSWQKLTTERDKAHWSAWAIIINSLFVSKDFWNIVIRDGFRFIFQRTGFLLVFESAKNSKPGLAKNVSEGAAWLSFFLSSELYIRQEGDGIRHVSWRWISCSAFRVCAYRGKIQPKKRKGSDEGWKTFTPLLPAVILIIVHIYFTKNAYKKSQMLPLIVVWTRDMAFLYTLSLELDDTVAMLDIGSNHDPSRWRAILMLPSQRFGL